MPDDGDDATHRDVFQTLTLRACDLPAFVTLRKIIGDGEKSAIQRAAVLQIGCDRSGLHTRRQHHQQMFALLRAFAKQQSHIVFDRTGQAASVHDHRHPSPGILHGDLTLRAQRTGDTQTPVLRRIGLNPVPQSHHTMLTTGEMQHGGIQIGPRGPCKQQHRALRSPCARRFPRPGMRQTLLLGGTGLRGGL